MTSETEMQFLGAVSEESGLEPADARILVEDFLTTLAGYVSPEAWQLVSSAVPFSVDMGRVVAQGDHGSTPKDFIAEMSGEEGVEEHSSALHARAVAEAIGASMSDDQRRRLAELVDDDFLALFETGRGELTEPDGAIPGVDQMLGEEEAREERAPDDVIATDGDRLE